jgi:hypothetical protein
MWDCRCGGSRRRLRDERGRGRRDGVSLEGTTMGVDRVSSAGTDEVSSATGRAFRAFGLLRRHDAEAPASEPEEIDAEPELHFSLDPDVARRIALYVGQEPGDTDLTRLTVR